MRATRPRLGCHRTTWRQASLALLLAGVASPGVAGWEAAYAPVDLDVVDVDATVAIASKAGERVPIVVIHDAAVAMAVGGAFDAVFAETREHFMARLQSAFGSPVLDEASAADQTFRDFRADFQAGNTRFPVGPALARTWAWGFDGEPVRERVSTLLRAIERDQLIGSVRPASSVFVLEPGAAERARTWGEVAARARSVDPSTILSVPAAGELLRRMSDPLDRSADGYLAGMIRANVSEDRHLTGLLLRERLGDAAVQRTFARGSQLIRAGQPVDAWAALAVEQLARAGIQMLDAPLSGDPERPGLPGDSEAGATDAASGATGESSLARRMGWLAGGMIVLAAGVVGFAMSFARRRARGTPAKIVDGAGAGESTLVPSGPREWRERIVRALFTQRSVLLANEQAASRRVQEMEERLARLQPAIAERIRSYEQRIDALENEIAERDAETRDLLRAKLVLARKELEAEVTRSRISWN